jgi:hypothetical protein
VAEACYGLAVTKRRPSFEVALARLIAELTEDVFVALARRALCLAALGRNAEATAALRDLADRHPTYPMMAGAQLVGRMLQALRAGDLAAAHEIAARRTPDLPIELEEETLADLLVTTGDPSPMADEVARLDAELKEDAALRDWVCAVWPKAESYVEMAGARAKTA